MKFRWETEFKKTEIGELSMKNEKIKEAGLCLEK
jgi:hypothetical protein